MALQLGALRDALIEAGASTEKANQAAEEVAAYERDIPGIKSDLRVLKSGQAVTLAGVLAIVVKLFVP